ncbi:MAG: hypothetical protein IJQ18_08545 [Paludibacteraceae bacterium]|nr:hypothetical protein [Paludibacteraceae bacterium]
MDYNAEQLETVEKLSSVFMKISDIALIIEVDEHALRADINSETSEVSRRYRRGKASSKLKILEQEMSLAQVGSPLALENTRKALLDMEDDE